MFPEFVPLMMFTQDLGCKIKFLSCLLDVVHNYKKHVKGEGVAPLAKQDPDEVAMATACDDSDMEDFMDYKYCTVLGFLLGLVCSLTVVFGTAQNAAWLSRWCNWT